MKNLGKVVHTTHGEHLYWKQELQKYLRVYRAKPHTMTKHTPASLPFNGRRYKTRIPPLTGKKHLLYDSEVRSNDAMSKDIMKRAADSKSYVKELDIKEGDTVLCRQAKYDKRTTPFHSKPMRVVMRRGSMVTEGMTPEHSQGTLRSLRGSKMQTTNSKQRPQTMQHKRPSKMHVYIQVEEQHS